VFSLEVNKLAKSVFVVFLRSPVGSVHPVEGLRIAAGMMSGDEDHKVTAAFIGKGSRCAIKGVDRSYAVKFLEMFPEHAGKKFYVEEESLIEQGIDRSQLADEFAVTSRKQLSEMLLKADFCLSF
jgi:sulfur relay (sulfurtransferase) DsrF/TusC family protein